MMNLKKKVLCGVIATSTLLSSMSCFPLMGGTSFAPTAYAANSTNAQDVKVYAGSEKIQSYGVEAQGSGSYVTGNIKGTVSCHSMEALYEAYNLSKTANYKILFARIKADKDRTVLKKVFENTEKVDLNYDLNFILQGNDFDITSVNITLKAVIMDYNGTKIKFISNRSGDSGAVTDGGDEYDGYTAL